jgi:HD-GYP domain-containing protein (c-di-GMP phosphodiesterase class II)
LAPIPNLTFARLQGSPSHNGWELLELYLSQLRQAPEVRTQLRLTLDMIREATGADVVYVCSLVDAQATEASGDRELPAQWYEMLTTGVVAQAAGNHDQALLCEPPNLRLLPLPQSLALVRLSQSRQAWLGALNFGRGRPLQPEDLKFLRLTRQLLAQQQQHTHTYDRLKESLFGLVRALTASIDARDPHTWGHSERVARIAVRLGREMKLGEPMLNDLYLGGLLHDIGKIGVRDEVLRKPGALTDEERRQVELHTVIGDEILSHVKQLAYLRPAVRNHHERYDGGGYPDGLAGEQIPLLARILAVADSCDAMMADRPYRKGLPPEQINAIFEQEAGRQWDGMIVQHFLSCRQEIYSICQRGLGESVVRALEQAILMGARTASVSAPTTASDKVEN